MTTLLYLTHTFHTPKKGNHLLNITVYHRFSKILMK